MGGVPGLGGVSCHCCVPRIVCVDQNQFFVTMIMMRVVMLGQNFYCFHWKASRASYPGPGPGLGAKPPEGHYAYARPP